MFESVLNFLSAFRYPLFLLISIVTLVLYLRHRRRKVLLVIGLVFLALALQPQIEAVLFEGERYWYPRWAPW